MFVAKLLKDSRCFWDNFREIPKSTANSTVKKDRVAHTKIVAKKTQLELHWFQSNKAHEELPSLEKVNMKPFLEEKRMEEKRTERKEMEGPGGGVMPYMCHTETCRRSGYTFWPSNPRQGVFFRSWLQIRVPNLYDHSESGCLFTVLFRTLLMVLTYLSFVQEINPSFDVCNIFKVLIWHTVQEFVRVSFENNSFLCFDTLFRWLLSFPSSNLPLPPKKLVWKQ